MADKYLVCEGATVYCSKSIINNNPGTAVPLNITSQKTVVVNGDKVVATDKDCSVVNMNFGMCNNGSVPLPPCTANIQWSKVFQGAEVTATGLKLLTEESEGVCSFGGGKVKVAFHGQVAMPQMMEVDEVSKDVLSSILPVEPEKEEACICIEISDSVDDIEDEVRIVAVDILNDNGEPVREDFVQFVNLPKDPKFVNNKDVKGLYQLGSYIKCRVRFNVAGVHKFKLMLEEGIENIGYSEEEQFRNVNFRLQEKELDLITDIYGESIIESEVLYINQAGGNKYNLIVKDDFYNFVESVTITTQRKVYFTEIKMNGLSSITKTLSIVIEEYQKHFIILESLKSGIIPHIRNIGQDTSVFEESVKTAYQKLGIEGMKPIIIAYTDHLAVKEPDVPVVLVDVVVGQTVENPIRVQIPKKQALWHNLDDDWYIDCKYIDFATKIEYKIERDLITPILFSNAVGNHKSLDIDVRGLPEGLGRIELRINTVNRMCAGLSLKNSEVIAISTRGWWNDKPWIKQNTIIIHEMGHKVGMVPKGKGIELDKPINYYNTTQGHIGSHCHTGIPFQSNYEGFTKQALCVMYGAMSDRTAFCDDCADCMRKLDLTNLRDLEIEN